VHKATFPAEDDPAAQLVHVAAPAAEYLPTAHDVHEVTPEPVAYLPARQETHAEASEAPVVDDALPPLHWVQLVMLADTW